MSAELPDLFAEALELGDAERRRLLDRIAEQSPPRAERLAAMLLAAERQNSLLDGTPPGISGKEPAAESPERVGPYRILHEIGRGGMGRVFLAEQEEAAYRRTVALKLLDRAASGEEGVRRFRDEVRILASLEHPGIARFLDGGQAADGTWFLALEFVEGVDLLRHCDARQLGTRQRVILFLAVLDAVAYAHGRGVVHRDLKPSNILVGADGRPRLLDFGISKLIEPAGEGASATLTTRFEHRAFTPAYASPEQFRSERATTLSDVFSLGVLLYEVLTGVRPFGSATSSHAELQGEVLAGNPKPPRVVRKELARDLDAICLKALAVEPGARYGSAAALADDLRAHLGGRPVAARRGGQHYRLMYFLRRRAGRLQTAALAVAVVGLLATGYWARRTARTDDPPSQPFPFSASAVSARPLEELERDFAMHPASVVAGAQLVMAQTTTGRHSEATVVVRRLREIPGHEDDPLIDYVDGRLAENGDQLQRALVLYTRGLTNAVAQRRGELVSQIRSARGRTLLSLGQRDEALADLEQARDGFEQAKDWPSLVAVSNDLAVERLQTGYFDEGEELLQQALRATQLASPGARPPTILINLAEVAVLRGRPDIAIQRDRELLKLVRASTKTTREMQIVRSLGHLARSLWEAGHAAESEEALTEAIAGLPKVKARSIVPELLQQRGKTALARGRLADVEKVVGELRAFGAQSTDRLPLALAALLAGRLDAQRGRYDEAQRQLAEARAFFLANADHNETLGVDLASAEAQLEAGDLEAAVRAAEEAAAPYRSRQNLASALLQPAEVLLARIQALQGRTDEAAVRLRQIDAGATAAGIPADQQPALDSRLAFLASRAEVALAEGRPAEARRDLETAILAGKAGDRVVRVLNLRLQLARAQRAAGDERSARAEASAVALEAKALGLTAIADAARRSG